MLGVDQFWTLDLIVRNKKNYAKVLEIEFLNWAKPDEVIMKYFAFLQTIIFLVPIFQPIITYLTFQKPTWLTIPRELWPKRMLSDIFI